jgi:hypothetical protein
MSTTFSTDLGAPELPRIIRSLQYRAPNTLAELPARAPAGGDLGVLEHQLWNERSVNVTDLGDVLENR